MVETGRASVRLLLVCKYVTRNASVLEGRRASACAPLCYDEHVATQQIPGVRFLLCTEHGVAQSDLVPDDIDRFIAVPGNVLWLDLDTSINSDLSLLAREFNFHELAIEDTIRQAQRAKIDHYDGFNFIVFYAVDPECTPDALQFTQVSMFVARNYLVTVHYGRLAAIEESATRWRTNVAKLERDMGALLYSLLDTIVDDYFPVIDGVSDVVEEIEEAVFERFSNDALQKIFHLKKSLLQMRRVVAPERDVINVILRRESPVFSEASFVYFQDIYDHLARVTDSIDIYRDLLASAVDAYLSMSSNRLNEIMRTLTSYSIPLMVGAMLAGIWGMNFEFMPELGWRLGYPLALSLIFGSAFGIMLYFRRRKWL